MAQAGRTDHDALYHRLFSHPGVVAQLVREFVGPSLAGHDMADLDLDRMERLNTKFHADTGERREADMVWRIPHRDGGETYLLLLLEFQSTSDPWMALRVLAYAALLWQQLVREQRLPPGGKLPPVLPVVLYNGDPRWRAPVTLRDLVALPEGSALWQWQPDIRYHLIDEGAFSATDLTGLDGLPPLLFRLENSPDPNEVVVLADAVLAWFGRHPGFQAAQAVFAELLGSMMAPLGPDIRVPEDLLEVRNMLATRAEQWKQDWLQEGLQKGRQEGHQEGLKEGLKEGRQKGLQDGRQEGRQEGLQEGRQEGRQEGVQKGRQEGEAALLLRLLEHRFGSVPDWARQRVLAAAPAVVEQWGVRILDAHTLDEVLA